MPQRILICGFGFMGEMHARALADIPDVAIVGIVDARPELAQERIARLELGVPVFADLGRALRELDPSIVNICLPTDQHAEASIEALAAGKHVFCEKPISLALEEARRIAAAHAKARTFFQVGQCIRFWPEYQAFVEFVGSGRGGKLLSLSLQRRSARPQYTVGNWIGDPRRSLGAALDLHIHDTDFVLHLLGLPRAVSSRGTRDEGGWSHIFTHYDYPDVAVAAEGGWNYPPGWGFQMAFQAVFERAAVEYDSGATPTLRVTFADRGPEPLPFVQAGGNATGVKGNLSSLGGYANELRYFVECVTTGCAPEIATLEQATASLGVVLAEVQSADTRRPVALDGAK